MPDDGRQAELLRTAAGEAQAADAILGDPLAPSSTAAVHVVRGFEALAELDKDDGALAKRAAALHADDVDAETIRTGARELRAAVAATHLELHGTTMQAAARRRLLVRAIVVALCLAPAVAILVWTFPPVGEGQWRGRYYPTPDFSGEPVSIRDGDVRFSYRDEAPHKDLPRDGFSIRWDTCMRVTEPLDAYFQLTSDDGSRLFIDGATVVDNWGRHGKRARGEQVRLEPGLHHLRVEFFDEDEHAEVSLSASLRGELPASVPARLLVDPGENIDEADPCVARN